MDLEKLTKHQILLLTLLVSFVTSIATGIVTVSLMDQAPEGVTKIINQVVERTVETVVPSTQGAAVATEKTVVVKQDELVPQSIATVQKSIVRIVARGSDQLIARGIIIDSKGTTITDGPALAAGQVNQFEAILPSGARVPAKPRGDLKSEIVQVDLTLGTSTGFVPAKFADSAKLTLGQTVLRIGGIGSDSVGEGVVAALPTDTTKDVIYASVSSATPGSVLITIFGEVIGMNTSTHATDQSAYKIISLPAAPTVTNTTPNT
ncbi:MAG: trypsin-like peptidase domain-containing protein [Candidatus Pacebacteria bacterium]|nr:trypsin-like peptidase domain-containing protein [Candidatus Paceibacterota bacterium]